MAAAPDVLEWSGRLAWLVEQGIVGADETQPLDACTERLSRAMTIVLALERLQPRVPPGGVLALLVLGPDVAEGEDEAGLKATFEAASEVLGRSHGVRELHIDLVGPNLPAGCERDSVTLPQALQAAGASGADARGAVLRMRGVRSLLHDEGAAAALSAGMPTHATAAAPRAYACAFAFNAGIWGYDSWRPTLQALGAMGAPPPPLVFTSYNELEADDDAGALEALGLEETRDWRWIPEPNPHRATRAWSNALGRQAADNAWWQCVDVSRLGPARDELPQ